MAVSVKDIKAIKPGQSVAFTIDHPRELNTIRSLCSYVGINHPELGATFHSKSYREKKIVIIEARQRAEKN